MFQSLNPSKGQENAQRGIDLAQKVLSIPPILDAADMANPKVVFVLFLIFVFVQKLALLRWTKCLWWPISPISVMLNQQSVCIGKIVSNYNCWFFFSLLFPGNDAALCRAYGPGLVEGVVDEVSEFRVEVPKDSTGKLEIKGKKKKRWKKKKEKLTTLHLFVVTGPKTSAVPEVTKNPQGVYECKFTPKEAGEWKVAIFFFLLSLFLFFFFFFPLPKVSVTLDGEHIPGSVFTVTVLEAISLGGEGKIRVYYSTTNKSGAFPLLIFPLQWGADC